MFAPTRLSEWALFVTIFQAAAIVNVGGGFAVGVAPFFFVATLVALRVLPEWWNGGVRFVRGEPGLRHVHVLTLFVGWTVFSAFVSPVLFAGTPVDSPRMGVDQGFSVPDAPSLELQQRGTSSIYVIEFYYALAHVADERSARVY